MSVRAPRVAFQGELGAFSQEAAGNMLGPSVRFVPCVKFKDVFDSLEANAADMAVLPVENTLHGSVHENYDHLLSCPVPIQAEMNLRIVHNLIGPPGMRLRDVRRVYSHPVALNQCLRFLADHPQVESIPFYDTAGSVKMVLQDAPEGGAAIASAIAASTYGGKILKRAIEDDRENYTRFVLLSRKQRPQQGKVREWKTSLVFTTKNIPGALFRSLSAFALRDINLTKLESRPLRGKPFEYLFYLDLIGSPAEERVSKALGHLEELADFLKVLGTYPRGI